MKPHNLNQVAVWMPMKHEDMSIKTFQQYTFMDKGIIQTASHLKPVIRYAKNYTVGDWRPFSLCIISLERDTEKMEAFLDEVALSIEPTDKTFVMTEVYYKP